MASPSASQLAEIEDAWMKELAQHGEVLTYPKGREIITEGKTGDTLYIILSGKVKVYVADGDGREMMLDVRGAGESVGEMMIDGKPRSASVSCLEPTTFSVLTRPTLKAVISANPEVAANMVLRLIHRARLATSLVRDLALRDVYERVTNLLLHLAVEQPDGTLAIQERLSQAEVARRVGASRDMVNRIFRELVEGGYISHEDKKVVLLKRKLPPRF